MSNQNRDLPNFPPARPELTAEIVALDCLLADLIVKCQGNARELDRLGGVLDDHLATCEQARDTLLGLSIQERQELTMTDLPMSQQRMIFAAGLTNAYLLEELGVIYKTDPLLIGEKISLRVNLQMADIQPEQITETLRKYLIKREDAVKKHKEAAIEHYNITVQTQEDNN
jgi:hypothetical protein